MIKANCFQRKVSSSSSSPWRISSHLPSIRATASRARYHSTKEKSHLRIQIFRAINFQILLMVQFKMKIWIKQLHKVFSIQKTKVILVQHLLKIKTVSSHCVKVKLIKVKIICNKKSQIFFFNRTRIFQKLIQIRNEDFYKE